MTFFVVTGDLLVMQISNALPRLLYNPSHSHHMDSVGMAFKGVLAHTSAVAKSAWHPAFESFDARRLYHADEAAQVI